jgi:large subunit ribosomal protein L15
MPLQRRLPKVGFRSALARASAEVRLHELELVDADVIDVLALKSAQIVPQHAERVKVILSGKLTKAVTLKGVAVTKGARAAIEAAGGKVEE